MIKEIRSLTRLFRFARFQNWWFSKIPPLLAVIYLSMLLRGPEFRVDFPLLVCYMVSVCCVAIFGHIINDVFDVRPDLQSGKRNEMADVGWGPRVVMGTTFLFAGFLPALSAHYSATSLLLLALNYLWPTIYSVPFIRLKERGVLGIFCDALGSHITPALFALSLFGDFDSGEPAEKYCYPVIVTLWATVLGLKGILHHQSLDRESDVRSGTVTFVTKVEPASVDRFLNWFNLGVELPISTALIAVVYHSCPFGVGALAIYCGLELLRFWLGERIAITSNTQSNRAVIPFTNELFYILWLPMAAAMQLAASDLTWWWLPVVHATIFYRTILMERLELNFVGQKILRFVRWNAF